MSSTKAARSSRRSNPSGRRPSTSSVEHPQSGSRGRGSVASTNKSSPSRSQLAKPSPKPGANTSHAASRAPIASPPAGVPPKSTSTDILRGAGKAPASRGVSVDPTMPLPNNPTDFAQNSGPSAKPGTALEARSSAPGGAPSMIQPIGGSMRRTTSNMSGAQGAMSDYTNKGGAESVMGGGPDGMGDNPASSVYNIGGMDGNRTNSMYGMGGNTMGSMYGMGGNPMGSMYGMGGNAMGSMYGMGGNAMGSMYGMGGNPMGSMYGMGGNPMGSMYGMGGPMGSMYGMGGNPMGSMYGMGGNPMGSMYGGMGSNPVGSMYGMGGNPMGSMYGMGGNPMGSMYGMGGNPMGSMYGVSGASYHSVVNAASRRDSFLNKNDLIRADVKPLNSKSSSTDKESDEVTKKDPKILKEAEKNAAAKKESTGNRLSKDTKLLEKKGATDRKEAEKKDPKEVDGKGANEADKKGAKEGEKEDAKEADPKDAKEADPKDAKEADPKGAKEADPKGVKEADPKGAKEADKKDVKEADPKDVKEADPKDAKEADKKDAKEADKKDAKEADKKDAKDNGAAKPDDEASAGAATSSKNDRPVKLSGTKIRSLALIYKSGNEVKVTLTGKDTVVMDGKETKLDEAVLVEDPSKHVDASVLSEVRNQWLSGHNATVFIGSDTTQRTHAMDFIRDYLSMFTGKLASIGEYFNIYVTVTALDGADQGRDLLKDGAAFERLALASSPVYGPALNNMTTKEVDTKEAMEEVLKEGMGRAKEGEVICSYLVLKQCRKGGAGAMVYLSSLNVTLVGPKVEFLTGLKDKKPEFPCRLYRYSVGGGSHTACIGFVSDDDASASKVFDVLKEMREIENTEPRSGNVKRFIEYTKKEIPKCKEKVSSTSEENKKANYQTMLKRMEMMLKDAEDLEEDPKTVVPKAYIVQLTYTSARAFASAI